MKDDDQFPVTRLIPPSDSDRRLIEALLGRLGAADPDRRDVRLGSLIDLLGPESTLKANLQRLHSGITVDSRERTSPADDLWQDLRQALGTLRQRIEALQRLSLPEDLQDLLVAAVGEHAAIIVAQHLGFTVGAQRPPDTAAADLSAEHILRIEHDARQRFQASSIYSPALDRALQLAHQWTPCSAAQLNRALVQAELITTPWLPSTLVLAADLLHVPHTFVIETGLDGERLTDGNGDASPRATLMLAEKFIRAASQAQGAAAMRSIAFELSELLDRRVSLAEMRSIAEALPNAQWIDDAPHEWIRLESDSDGEMLHAVRKLLSIVPQMSIHSLYEGLLLRGRGKATKRHDMLSKDELLRLLEQVPWLHIRRRLYVEAAEHVHWRTVLHGEELILVEVLSQSGGVLDLESLRLGVEARGLPGSAVDAHLRSSPLFVSPLRGIWALRGVDLSERLIELARQRGTLPRPTEE